MTVDEFASEHVVGGAPGPGLSAPEAGSQARVVAYYNGSTMVGGCYQIGRLVSRLGETGSLGRKGRLRVLAPTRGWEWLHVKDPYVLVDAGMWRLWYAGFDGDRYRLGYAESDDGVRWRRWRANPVLDCGGPGAFDERGCSFPVVCKDPSGRSGRRYRLIYSGLNSAGAYQIGHAYSPDGIAWTKAGGVPVVSNGRPGSWYENEVRPGALIRWRDGFLLFVCGGSRAGFPEDGQVGLVAVRNFDQPFATMSPVPILGRRLGEGLLVEDCKQGSRTVVVADAVGLSPGEVVCLYDGIGNVQQVSVAGVDAATIRLARPAHADFQVAHEARIQTTLRALLPRSVVRDGDIWRMWLTAYQVGSRGPEIETTYSASSVSPNHGWVFDHAGSPPLPLPDGGRPGAWDSRAAENPMLALDAESGRQIMVLAGADGPSGADVRVACQEITLVTRAVTHPLAPTPTTGLLTVSIDAPPDEVMWVRAFVNSAVGGSHFGEWIALGVRGIADGERTALFDLETAELRPGVHRIGINIGLRDGRTVHWYEQAGAHYFTVRPDRWPLPRR